jgi:hypothetical protein
MDEKLLITSGRDREVRVWDIATRKNIVSLRHESYVPVLALGQDDQRLVTVTDEGEMRVWHFRTGDCLTPGVRDTPRQNTEQPGIVVARVSQDDKTLLFRVSEHAFFSVPMPPKGVRAAGVVPEVRRGPRKTSSHAGWPPGDPRIGGIRRCGGRLAQNSRPGDEIALRWANGCSHRRPRVRFRPWTTCRSTNTCAPSKRRAPPPPHANTCATAREIATPPSCRRNSSPHCRSDATGERRLTETRGQKPWFLSLWLLPASQERGRNADWAVCENGL